MWNVILLLTYDYSMSLLSHLLCLAVQDVEREFSLDEHTFQDKFGVLKPQLDSCDLVFHCQMGRRGEVATEKARSLGFIKYDWD